ncbi:MAG: hypothetical protein RR601_01825, partial [Erysipelotrichales bacterium]
MKKIIKLAVFLGVICVIASGALFYANSITAPIITANAKANTDKLLKEIIKADKYEEEAVNEGSISNVYYAYKGDKKIASIYQVETYGFQSEVKVLFAIDDKGKFISLKTIEQAETP